MVRNRQPSSSALLSPRWTRDLQLLAMPGIDGRYNARLPFSGINAADISTLFKAYANSRFGPVTYMGCQLLNAPATYYTADLKAFDGSSNYTTMFVGANISEANVRLGVALGDASAGGNFHTGIRFNSDKGTSTSAGKLCFMEYNSGVVVAAESAATEVDGQIGCFIGRRKGSTPSIWKNGKDVTSSTTTSASTNSSWQDRWCFGLNLTGYTTQVSIMGCAWSRALSDAEIVELGRNPWQIFDAGDDEDIYYAVASAASAFAAARYYNEMIGQAPHV